MSNQASIAVLPFLNLSSEKDNEYFSDGITEEIINALTHVKGLKVIARTSSFAFKGKNEDVRKIGAQLGVSTLLEGSVRKIKNRVRITAQLIETAKGTHYWSRNFDRELTDIFALQDEISLLIANEVRNNFGHFDIQEHLVKDSTRNINAYELFLKGRYCQLQWTPDALREAIDLYNQAIAADPNFARAYYGNLQCYGLLAAWGYMPYEEGMEKAAANFLLARELDTQLPEYPLSFVGKRFWGEWEFKAAYGHIQEVLEMNPNHIDGLEAMAELFIVHGYFDLAHQYANRLLEVDPLAANNHYTLANIHYYQGDYEVALDRFSRALNIREDFELARHKRALCLIGLNRQEHLEAEFKGNPHWQLQQLLCRLCANGPGELPEEQVANLLQSAQGTSQLAPYELFILANSAHKNLALEMLRGYIGQRRGQIINYRQEPLLQPLHALPEFETLHLSTLQRADIALPAVKSETPRPVLDPEQQEALKDELLSHFQEQKPFLDSQLSLGTVAELLGIGTNKLSYLINEAVGVNFNEFVNGYRLNHFKEIALLPANRQITLLGLAYDSGFNSKSVFNTFFKKAEGLTPSQWLKKQLKG